MRTKVTVIKGSAPLYNKVEDLPSRVAAPEAGYDPHGDWTPQTTPKDWGLLGLAHDVLTSNTDYASALSANIRPFFSTLKIRPKITRVRAPPLKFVAKYNQI